MATESKKKEPLPEEEEVKKAKKAPKKSAAETMSKGAVKPAPAPDPVAKGVKAMDDFSSGVKADGSYMTPDERKAAFSDSKAARQGRFTMKPEAASAPRVTTRSLAVPAVPAPAPVTSRGVIPHPYLHQASPGPAMPVDDGLPLPKNPSGPPKPAPKPSFGSRYGGTLGALGVMGADAVIPRADDSTAAGYDINTARDTAVGAASWALPFMRNPRVAVPVALATGGYNLYRRLTDYHQANPTAQQDYEYQLPKADPNFWSQAPAALSDLGHLGSQSIRGFGNLVDRALNTYTPYPYMVKASQAVADYFTPPGLQGSQPPAPQNPLVNRALNPSSPINVVTGKAGIGVGGQKSLSDQMKEAGYLRADFPELTQGQRLGEQPLLPEYQDAKQRYLADLKSAAQSGQPIENVNFIDADAAERARLAQSTSQQDRINKILQERDRKMAEDFSRKQEEFKAATSPEASRNFFEGVKLRRQAQDFSSNQGGDPFENARRAQAFADNAARQAELTPDPNDSAMDFIPERDFRNSPNPSVEAARAIAQTRQQGGEDPSQLDVVGQVLAHTPGMDPAKTAAFLSQLENQRLQAENIRIDNERMASALEQNALTAQFKALSDREQFLQERLADTFDAQNHPAYTTELANLQNSKNELIKQNPDLFGSFAPSEQASMTPAEAEAALAQARMLVAKNPARKDEVNQRLTARGLPPIP